MGSECGELMEATSYWCYLQVAGHRLSAVGDQQAFNLKVVPPSVVCAARVAFGLAGAYWQGTGLLAL